MTNIIPVHPKQCCPRQVGCFLSAVLLMLLFLCCAQGQDIPGSWQKQGGRATLVFHRDGTFNAVDDMGMAVSGNYFLPGGNSIRFEIKRDGDSPEIINGTLAVAGDIMTLSSSDKKEVELYTRVK